jgi:hypothetical protein
MMALRNRFMNDRPILNIISVDSQDLVEIFGQHARGHETHYARADHNGSLSERLSHGLMPQANPDFGVHRVAQSRRNSNPTLRDGPKRTCDDAFAEMSATGH